jgi:alpha-D-xyloside xylohydrolase
MGYARGEFARIPLHWDDKARQLTVGERQGHFPGMAASRRIGVVVHDGGGGSVFAQAPESWLDYSGKALALRL